MWQIETHLKIFLTTLWWPGASFVGCGAIFWTLNAAYGNVSVSVASYGAACTSSMPIWGTCFLWVVTLATYFCVKDKNNKIYLANDACNISFGFQSQSGQSFLYLVEV